MPDLCAEINKFGKGIGNEARYRILEVLMKKPATVTELVKIVKQSQPAVSQHLKTLKECGLVNHERNGQEIVYSANAEYALKLLTSLVRDLEKNRKKK